MSKLIDRAAWWWVWNHRERVTATLDAAVLSGTELSLRDARDAEVGALLHGYFEKRGDAATA